MDVVFRFAGRITVLVAGAVLTEGTPEEISADERVRSVYLGERREDAAMSDARACAGAPRRVGRLRRDRDPRERAA